MKDHRARQLSELTSGMPLSETIGSLEVTIRRLAFDSRKISAGDCFIAVKGTQFDGHQFIETAIENGAVAIVCEDLPKVAAPNVTYLKVDNSAHALALMAHRYFGQPSHYVQLVGITGTNGKTTTATLLYQLFMQLGLPSGLLSTVENRIGERVVAATHTTPDPLALNELLAEMVDANITYVFMEVSSHAIDQHRIGGLQFAGGVFTNITHDHLDYHGTFKAYIQAKKAFFDQLPKGAFALTNADDKNGAVMLQNTRAGKYSYSLRTISDFKAKVLENLLTGLHLQIDGHEVFARLSGHFNAYNLLVVYAVARLLDQDTMEVLTALSALKGAEGRFETVRDDQRQVTAVIDYAHTPDALEKVLTTIRQMQQGQGQLICVVGCGGDRDKAKRPLMAKAATLLSDQVILTSDNPRTEEPIAIIEDMEKGIPPEATSKVLSITDRRQAIRTAAKLAQPGDLILIAGKGHEKYQDIKGKKLPFDDKIEIRKAFE